MGLPFANCSAIMFVYRQSKDPSYSIQIFSPKEMNWAIQKLLSKHTMCLTTIIQLKRGNSLNQIRIDFHVRIIMSCDSISN